MERNPARTRERILAAALAEFAAKGFAGARVDLIARRARANKRMLYHLDSAKFHPHTADAGSPALGLLPLDFAELDRKVDPLL
jgi:hypothetical protein